MTTSPSRPAPAVAAAKARAPSAAPLLVRGLRTLDTELASAIPRVLALGDSDEEAIHDLRVAIRRLRTLLKLARPIFGRFYADAVRAAFTVVHRATGALRDEEVLDETLALIENDAPSFVAWKARRRARERSLRRGVVERLRKGDLTRARALLKALVTLPIAPDRDRSAAKLARRAVDRARKGVEQLRDMPTTDPVGLHELRIAYKELRYAAELLAPALPADLAAMAEPAARFQKRLGEIHDADVAILTVTRARGLDPATQAAVRVGLEALRAKRVAKYVAEMAPLATTPAGDPERPEPPESLPAKSLASKTARKPAKKSTPAKAVRTSASTRSGRSPAS